MTDVDRDRALQKLLQSLFTAETFRRHLEQTEGHEFVAELPGPAVPPAQLFWDAIKLFHHHGSIDRHFFHKLVEVRPKRAGDIGRVCEHWFPDSKQTTESLTELPRPQDATPRPPLTPSQSHESATALPAGHVTPQAQLSPSPVPRLPVPDVTERWARIDYPSRELEELSHPVVSAAPDFLDHEKEEALSHLHENSPIEELPLSARARNGLERAGLVRAFELLDFPEMRLMMIRGLGSRAANEIANLRRVWLSRRADTHQIEGGESASSHGSLPPSVSIAKNDSQGPYQPLTCQLASSTIFLARVAKDRRDRILHVVDYFVRHSWTIPAIIFASAMQIAPRNVSGFVSHLAEDLNIDGNAIIYYDPIEREVRLDIIQLRQEFKLLDGAK